MSICENVADEQMEEGLSVSLAKREIPLTELTFFVNQWINAQEV
jgi:hypothetical protein